MHDGVIQRWFIMRRRIVGLNFACRELGECKPEPSRTNPHCIGENYDGSLLIH